MKCSFFSVKYDESVWMKVHGRRGGSALLIDCVYTCLLIVLVLLLWIGVMIGSRKMYCEGNSCAVDFNARVGRSIDVDDVIGLGKTLVMLVGRD